MYGNDNPAATTIAGARSLAMPPRLRKKIHSAMTLTLGLPWLQAVEFSHRQS